MEYFAGLLLGIASVTYYLSMKSISIEIAQEMANQNSIMKKLIEELLMDKSKPPEIIQQVKENAPFSKKAKKKRNISDEQRAKISLIQKKRWEKYRLLKKEARKDGANLAPDDIEVGIV